MKKRDKERERKEEGETLRKLCSPLPLPVKVTVILTSSLIVSMRFKVKFGELSVSLAEYEVGSFFACFRFAVFCCER